MNLPTDHPAHPAYQACSGFISSLFSLVKDATPDAWRRRAEQRKKIRQLRGEIEQFKRDCTEVLTHDTSADRPPPSPS